MNKRMRKKADTRRAKRKAALIQAAIPKLRKEAETAKAGAGQLQMAMDSILARLAVKYGEQETDGDGRLIGYRLVIPETPVSEVLAQYRVLALKDDEEMVIGVFPKRD